MYKMLIVDDEPFILEGMAELFSKNKRLEIYKASNGDAALALLEAVRVDIVMTDIEMPGMGGMELLNRICRKWPFCKVIILSAYASFSYAKEAIENHIFRYLLKTDGEEKIYGTVEECIEVIEKEMQTLEFLSETGERIEQEIPFQQNECLLRIFGWMPLEQIPEELDTYRINLDFGKPLVLTAVRIDKFPENADRHRQFEIMIQVREIIKHYMSPKYGNTHVSFPDRSMIWAMQNRETEESTVYLKEMFEIVQRHCMDAAGIAISIVYDDFTDWMHVQARFSRLKTVLEQMLINKDSMMLVNLQYYMGKDSIKETTAEQLLLKEKLIEKLKGDIENNEIRGFRENLKELLESLKKENVSMGEKLSLYHVLAQMMLNQFTLSNLLEEMFELPEYFDFFYHYCDEDRSFLLLTAMMEKIVQLRVQKKEESSIGLMNKINRYIDINISEDLSLTKLSDTFHMNPAYLSRVYKQISGGNISDYIAARRLELAKRLLRESTIKINRIALQVGYESPSYFNRMFKKMEGITPQEYRDEHDLDKR